MSGTPPGEGAAPALGTRRRSLGTRVAVLTCGVVILAVTITGLGSYWIVHNVTKQQAQAGLRAQAQLIARVLQDGGGTAPGGADAGVQNLLRLLARAHVGVVVVEPNGHQADRNGGTHPAVVLPDKIVNQLLAGRPVDRVLGVGGRRTVVEGVRLGDGRGLLLTQRLSAVRSARVGRPLLVALAAGTAGGVLVAVIMARWVARPLRRAAAAARRLAAGSRDVRIAEDGPAEVADVASAINALTTALHRSESREREFLLSVSHELRTPLTTIGGFAEALADGVTAPPDVPAVGQILREESARMTRLVTDLLDLARLGADDFRLEHAVVDLAVLVEAAGAAWRPRCEAAGIELRVEVPGGSVEVPAGSTAPDPPGPVAGGQLTGSSVVVADAVRLRQILDGLAENALRVVPAGAPIVFAAGAGDGQVWLQVRDGGPGLTDEDCAVAFERSALYDRYRGIRRVGTGLGLALVAGLATRMGGAAHAGRAPEGGAAFTVTLPAVSAQEPAVRP